MPVVINRRSPLGLPEFAELYTGNGVDPMEAASQIHLNFPMEAKSLLADRWKGLGINMAPEQYFARVAKQAKAAAPSPAMQPVDPMAPAWPTFNTVAERDIAIASGAFDPAYASPLQKSHVQALEAIDKKDREAIRARAKEVTPVGLKPNLAAQLAGDTTGLAKKIMIRNMGFNNIEDYYASADPLALEADPRLKPLTAYKPKGGYGPLAGREIPNRLDLDIVMNPDFEEAMAKDPEGAKYAYERLTGRAYDADLNEAIDTRKSQLAIGRKYATEALQRGAFRDPTTGKWKVWNMQEAEPGIGLGATRPNLAFIDASGPQAKWLDTHYESIMNEPLPQEDPKDRAHRQSIDQTMMGVPEYTQHVTALEKKYGRTLTTKERDILAKVILQQLQSTAPVAQGAKNLGNWATGPLQDILNVQGPRKPFDITDYSPEELAAMGIPTSNSNGY